VKHPKDAIGAFSKAVEHISHPKVLSWMQEAKEQEILEKLDCTINIGHVRYGFTLAFHFLHYEASFEQAIAKTLLCGGDTDTNAAIVGGLLGAFHGFEKIPTKLVKPVLEYNNNIIVFGVFCNFSLLFMYFTHAHPHQKRPAPSSRLHT
jgi:ADP-ribosylglycohydrolase